MGVEIAIDYTPSCNLSFSVMGIASDELKMLRAMQKMRPQQFNVVSIGETYGCPNICTSTGQSSPYASVLGGAIFHQQIMPASTAESLPAPIETRASTSDAQGKQTLQIRIYRMTACRGLNVQLANGGSLFLPETV